LKRNSIFVLALALFSLIDGYLLSAISLVGRTGINLFYTQYKFLKTWWKGALLVFIVWAILFTVQSYFGKRASKATSNIINCAALIIAIIGLYLSYADFRNSLSHRWLGERFHLGVYLFWLGWIAISIFMLLKKREAGTGTDTTPRQVSSLQ
jgi:hypothetical protein